MVIFETVLTDVVVRAPGVKSFRFKPAGEAVFKAGQFFFVSIKIKDEERTKHFSFSNSPTEKGYIEFTKRITGSEFSTALDGMKPGEWAKIKLPYGSFTLKEGVRKIAFLSGGIGITPIRSMCKFATDSALGTDIVLLYGNNTERDIIFKEDFDKMASGNRSIKVIYTLTAEDADKSSWKGRTGFIDDRMVREEIPDFRERVFYVCGPPKMVGTLTSILKNTLNLKDDKIVTENFTGY